MGQHINLPGYIKLGPPFLSKEVLEEIQRYAWLLTSEDSPAELREQLRALIPAAERDHRIGAVRELGVVAQDALKRIV